MGKKSVYTKITPLPGHVPRQLALDMLHSHVEVIELNPLVTGVKPVDAPRDAVPDEYFSQWYEISEIITWGFGIKKKIAFKGVFHDQPWGLQTHVYAPMGVDMRNRYSIGGNQPGEPREARELGLDIPQDGLYLREDVEITCAVPMTMGFVKKEAKAATGIMIQRLTRKAELLDEGKLHAMFEQGTLKTSRPNMAATFADRVPPSPSDVSTSPVSSPGVRNPSLFSPATDSQGFGRYHDIVGRHDGRSNRDSIVSSVYQHSAYGGSGHNKADAEMPGMPEVYEMPGSTYPPQDQKQGLYPLPLRTAGGSQHFGTSQSFVAELQGDNTMLAPPGQNSVNGSPQPQYAAYRPSQSAQTSPQSSPALQPRQLSQGSSAYSKPPGPDYMQHPAHRNSSSAGGSASDRQNGVYTQQSDSNAIRDSRNSSVLEPDHSPYSSLAMHGSSQQPHRQSKIGMAVTTATSKCPVCGLFEGDESAVSHHVSRTHFA